MERYSTLGETKLAAAINSGDATMVVADPSKLPATGVFRVRIDDEVLLVSSVTGATYGVSRGVEGTTAANHSLNAKVSLTLTRSSLDGIRRDNVGTGTAAGLPVASDSFAGGLYIASDSPAVLQNTGSIWRVIGPVLPSTPFSGSWSWVNQGAAVLIDRGGILSLLAPANNGVNLRLRTKTQPATPITATCLLQPGLTLLAGIAGVGFYDQTSGRVVAIVSDRASNIAVHQYSSVTGGVTALLQTPFTHGPALLYFRIRNDGTSLFFSFSFDGVDFQQFYTQSRTAFLTGGPSHLCYFVSAENSGSAATSTFFGWEEE